jgi:peptide/nickel transport system substrate-binding protein
MSVAALVAVAACGGDDDDDVASPGSGAATTTEAPAETTGDTGTTPGTAEPTQAADTSVATTAGEGGGGEEGEPVKGGTLVYGLEADSANPWAPYRTSCATSCYIPLEAVTDSLFAVADDGTTQPLLVESVEHNADYTQWTLHIRNGIKFHDGTSLDGAAVKFNLESCKYSPLTATAFSSVDTVAASGQDVVITTKGGPWVALPTYLQYGSCGYMMSADWLASLPDVPQRNDKTPVYDAALAATPADGDPAKPVGLGAFTFESYTPGNGNSFKAVRNEDYWRGPKGITGEDLPYLDAIEAVVAVDIDSRTNAVRAGQFDVMHTANADSISTLKDDSDLETIYTTRYGDTGYAMLNLAQGATIDPEGKNAASPLLVLECRRALAEAIDQERYVLERAGGLAEPANGPFPPGSVGYLEDTGYPTYDVAAAQADMDTCLQTLGTDHITFNYNTTNDPFNVESNTLITSMWSDAFGDKVDAKIVPIEQGQYIGLALTGDFQAFGWRNHGGLDPDQQRLWWQSASSTPLGQQALNFGRFVDPVIDEALTTIKSNPDEAARKEAAETVNKRFGEQVYNLWLNWTVWGIISQPYVNGVEANVLPDGTKGVGLAFAGRHQLNEMWCDEGKCE